MKRFEKRCNQGFTLVELIVVVVVLVILSGAIATSAVRYATSAKEAKAIGECYSCVDIAS